MDERKQRKDESLDTVPLPEPVLSFQGDLAQA